MMSYKGAGAIRERHSIRGSGDARATTGNRPKQ
jgi:hypothetical protein